MKSKLIFILWLLMFSFFSCDFGIKENEETNSKEYFTVKGSCSIQGAIPSDLLPEKSIKQNAQRTVVPEIKTDVITVIFESETGETKSVEVVNKDGVLNFEIELPAGKWTVKAQGKKSDEVIIESESCQIELSAENKSATNVTLVLKPIQSDTGKGFFEFSFGMETPKVLGMKYTYNKPGATEPQSATINNFTAKENIKLSSGVYTFRFDFYSNKECTDKLLYSFTEVVNIFDGLTTDTWIGAGEYIQGEKICITDTMISQFVSTTVYVDENGDDSNLGTFFAPVNTIQKAVDKVIAMNEVTASSEENPYKILLLSDIISDDSFESNNNALVNINPSSASENPLYLKISKCGDGNATIDAKRSSSNTGRVMYIGKNANVTLQNLILKGGYLTNDNGAGLYILNNATVKIENSEISGNQAEDGGGLYLCPIANDDGGNLLELSNCTISGNTATSSGGGILFCPTHGYSDDKITTLNLTNCTISSNKATQMGGGICFYGKNPKVIMKDGSISGNTCISTGSSSYGGGVYVSDGTFSMEGCTISCNTAGSESSFQNAYGGGIYGESGTIIDMNHTTIFGNKVASVNDVNGAGVSLSGANLTMQENSTISGNSCVIGELASSYGGGVYINNSSTFTMTSGEISKNSAKDGGGVSVSGGKFIMNGGSISNNTADNNGGGVYVVKSNDTAPTFKISGNVSITEDNDVYLTAEQKITITGNLSTTGKVATITPQNYAETVQVLAPGKDFALDEQQVNKFKVTKYSDNVETIITIKEENGVLKNTLKGTATLTEELYEICSTINVSSADGMKAISDLSQKKGDVDGKTFKGKTIILENDVVLDDTYKLIKTFSGVFDGKDHYIRLTKPSEYGYAKNNYLGGAIFYVIKGEKEETAEKAEKAEVRNLNVYGEAYIAGIALELENDAVISNCNNYADITSPNGDNVHGCGGIVGELSNGGKIENCINEGTISYNNTNDKGCGGIVGVISSSLSAAGNSIIANCINNGEIIRVQIEGGVDQDASIGGICGEVTGNAAIYNCVNTGPVTSEVELTDPNDTENIGGITGYCSVSFYTSEFTSLPDDMGIFNCYNNGKISGKNDYGTAYVGGIVGKGCVDFSSIYNVYHTIRVTNTVNNDKTAVFLGDVEFLNNSVKYDITKNFYKIILNLPPPDYSSEGSTYDVNNIDSVIDTLNAYSDKTGREYLLWGKDSDGNIIFSE